MESYEQKSEQAASEAERLAEEGERVDREIADTKSDVQSKQGAPGMDGAIPESDDDRKSEDESDVEAASEGDEDGQ